MYLKFIQDHILLFKMRLGAILHWNRIVEEKPLRAELYSIEQFKAYAKKLAQEHLVSYKKGRNRLLIRLKNNEKVLAEIYELLNDPGKPKRKISSAGEWLLDNYYLIEEQIRLAQKYLPENYIRELPYLLQGQLCGYPRVYALAMDFVSHSDGRLDNQGLLEFVMAYQTRNHLKLGELWAIPIMLRLALIENLRRVASRLIVAQSERDKANYWATRILKISPKDTDGMIFEIAAMSRDKPLLSEAFAAEFTRRLHSQSQVFNLPFVWLEKKLLEQGETLDRIIRATSQKQAADQVSIANTIGSLRFLETTDWHSFVEALSVVEKILCQDPSGDYSRMSFTTRDRYRHVIEKLSLKSKIKEEEVAMRAIRMAKTAKMEKGPAHVSAHVGFYLIDRGLELLYRELGLRLPLLQHLQAKKTFWPSVLFFGSIISITLVVPVAILNWLQLAGVLDLPWLVLFGILLLLTASQTAVSLVNWFSMMLVNPQVFARMDFSEGIPAYAHTLVVVPCLISDKQTVELLLEGLEVRYLANIDANVDFALLTDYSDAEQEAMPDDKAILTQVMEGIEKLNYKYRRQKEYVFYLFHRSRKWNERERVWMGYERKRGKLGDLNAFLRGKGEGRFSAVVGDPQRLQNVKYVITLDADTLMPRDAARDLVGVIEHPLNRPVYDEKKQRVVSGYGILQPRVESGYPGENPSLFVKIFGGDTGIDPYTKVVSDVYQDLFFEGSFVGKGLYDVDVFERSMEGRFPENSILSHDLLEGCYARSGLVTDVQFYEKYPSAYLNDLSRRSRWICGDWQIIHWLFSWVRLKSGAKVKNPISFLSQWKIADNLRRSLVPLATVLLLLSGWIFLQPSWRWSALVIALLGFPLVPMTLAEAVRKSKELTFITHFSLILSLFKKKTIRFFFSLVFLLHEFFCCLNAITRTLWRMFVSRRNLLKWTTFFEAQAFLSHGLLGYYKNMLFEPLAAALLLICFSVFLACCDGFAYVLLSLWFISPAVAFRISQSAPVRKSMLSNEQITFLRNFARRSWAFFENFVTEKDHWLPPDNFQEEPLSIMAHRTSPTNIGLSLLANLTAYDFGYVSMGRMFNRTEKTFDTLNFMERYRGNFYNWYDTETLKPLEPLYVSSVDSGNLTGHLMILRCGLAEMNSQKIVSVKIFDGLEDTLQVLQQSVVQMEKSQKSNITGFFRETSERIMQFQEKGKLSCVCLSDIYTFLRQFSKDVSKVFSGLDQKYYEQGKKWARALERQCYDFLEDMSFIAPWILLEPEMPGMWDAGDEEQQKRLVQLREALRSLDEIPTLSEVAKLEQMLVPLIEKIAANISLVDHDSKALYEWFLKLCDAIKDAGTRSAERIKAIDYIVLRCNEISSIEYEFLYDKNTDLLSIGYNVSEHKVDSGCYDLLASEARFCSFVAIAQGKMPQDHWFKLGRMIAKVQGDPVLISWGGSMFEYLMPLLVMPNYEGSLLDQTYKAAVSGQIRYAAKNNIPWGISESGYNKIDANMVYQYHSFGVPEMGFKRGLAEDLVVAPYASMLALMVEPKKACENLERLFTEGAAGTYGFYEAVDYTPERLAPDETHAIVKSYMAHHQGMSFLSLAYVLLGRPMQRRFHAELMFKSAELLLQERVPVTESFLYDFEVTGMLRKFGEKETLLRVFTTPQTPVPEVHPLSNGRYHVMVTNAGGGYSRWQNVAVTRWSEDSALDNDGTFIYLRDVETGQFWSSAYQPTQKKPKNYEALFSQAWVEFKRRDYQIDTHTEIAVSPEDDIELRRLTITNRSRNKRVIEVTSYAEVVLNDPASDQAQRIFSNLFLQTEIIRSHQAILCQRRGRSDKEVFPWMLHLMAVHGNAIVGASYETDRSKFIGRGHTVADPVAIAGGSYLSDSEGSVLDPIVAIRSQIELEPDESAVVDYVTGICESRQAAQALMEKYRDRNLADRVFNLAWTHGQVALQQINSTDVDAQLYGRLASAILYANPALRASASILRRNNRGQSDLWGYSISGDLPIVLVRIENQDNIDLIVKMIQAHAYWRMKGLAVDLVIWNENSSIYRDSLGERISGLIFANSKETADKNGGIFLKRPDQMSDEDRILMQAVARIIISDRGGTLAEQLSDMTHPKVNFMPFVATRQDDPKEEGKGFEERPDLVYFNGVGGFTGDGREYVITTSYSKTTPAPWVNVLANWNFGTVVSESGSAYTWSENAREFRLTTCKNDPVTDASGEALYIRDEESGRFWSPTPLPATGKTQYTSRHGFGYSVFEHTENGIVSELTVFVSREDRVKFSVLKIRNISGRRRRLSATGYCELVMGTFREKYHMHILTEIDPKSGALFARNPYNKEFPDRVVFMDVSEPTRFVTGDRIEFIGRNGTMQVPSVMRSDRLSGRVGAGMDPCVASQVKFELEDGQQKEIVFTFGAGKNVDEARDLLRRFGGIDAVHQELERVWDYWKRTLGVVYVETPDASINFLVNGWLQYQLISCRLMGRSGFYQSGGAFGFRDQLQDVMALMHSKPEMAREQLLAFAAHQFVEGDVQHWWHPPSGRGIRSHCSDDYLWLPFVTCLYVKEIGDTGILDETIGFLEGPLPKQEEESYFDIPRISARTGTLYEHCVLSVKNGLKFGVHGLPLMGSGDWNDGMNMVGREGKGESVWLAFFLFDVLKSMAILASQHGDKDFSEFCLAEAGKLAGNIEEHGWDGEWYRRAYFDSGDALGSSLNSECRIDSIPQSWAVLSGAVQQERARKAMDQVDRQLVDRKHAIVKLFDPPFDKALPNPGYIKGYVPGVRENGGQYTHAAIWAAIAFAVLGDKKRAWDLFYMINPVHHSDNADKCAVYRVEPYVMAGDVYSSPGLAGRGGWTWYSGSAGWMYQLIVKYLLGVRLKVDKIYFEPCLPLDWPSWKLHYRYRETFYHITFVRLGSSDRVTSIKLDGVAQEDMAILLIDDRIDHSVEVNIG
ncbi:MAG: glucoamylase family protein [Candidatus Omnitrophica bacterium]|nr:glucoamylase family protein [Candidatus Omnitrophota bacterium]MDD5665009.1 glucoamylase family protein [Candidatus Omnitrophota bacterium]